MRPQCTVLISNRFLTRCIILFLFSAAPFSLLPVTANEACLKCGSYSMKKKTRDLISGERCCSSTNIIKKYEIKENFVNLEIRQDLCISWFIVNEDVSSIFDAWKKIIWNLYLYQLTYSVFQKDKFWIIDTRLS